MAQTTLHLPLDADGNCMLCKTKPPEQATLICGTCATPWHVDCLSVLPETMASALHFECPDCTGDGMAGAPAPTVSENEQLFSRIREIEADDSLSEMGKARKRQELLSNGIEVNEEEKEEKVNDILGLVGESFKCSFCMQLPERPVTA